MEVVICPDSAAVAQAAAAEVVRVAREVGPSVVLGVATGSSPLGLYRVLADLVDRGDLDLSDACAFALDEYVGLPQGHPESYAEVVRRTVTEPLHLPPARVHVPNGFAEDIAAAGTAYEAAILAAGGIDIQILGIGTNGHIGFNEPGSSLASRTRSEILTQRTRQDNARFFASIDEVPTLALTQGLGTILDAGHALLIAQGEGKADAVAAMVEGLLTPAVPGSVLQAHAHATVVVDGAAASGLRHADYRHWANEERPAWQTVGTTR